VRGEKGGRKRKEFGDISMEFGTNSLRGVEAGGALYDSVWRMDKALAGLPLG
jgi:hypothetical protein